ncbi:MAG TPA: DUF4382 domain-containing protein [Longimicrobiales bacterium]
MKTGRTFFALALATSVFAACDDASGPDGADVRMFMSRSDDGLAVIAAGSTAGAIPLSIVDSINIRLTSIQAFSSSDSSDVTPIDLTAEGARMVNLLDLPVLATDSTLIGRDEVPVGTYNNIRLRFDSATITLNQAVMVGNVNYQPGTYQLTIPSGLSSGIKVQGATVVVDDIDDVVSFNLTFDPTTSVGTIVATGANKLMMSPVIHARANVNPDQD